MPAALLADYDGLPTPAIYADLPVLAPTDMTLDALRDLGTFDVEGMKAEASCPGPPPKENPTR